MTQQKSPTVGKRQGIKKSITGRELNTVNSLTLQDFSSCIPCANCPHFRLVRFNSRKIRHQCGYSGLWLESCGVIECPVRRDGVNCA